MELFRRDDQVALSAQDGGEFGPAFGAGVHPDLPFGQAAFSFGRLHNHREESGRRFLFVTALRAGRQTSFSPSFLVVLKASYCSLIDSSSETADHRVTLAKEGMLGSCATSSRRLIALAALTARLCFGSWSIKIESLTIFRMFLGVMFESAICWSVVVAFASFASFSCCFLILVLVV